MKGTRTKRAFTSLVTAGLLVGLNVLAGPIGCGGASGGGSKTAQAVTGDVAKLPIYIVKSDGSSDPYEAAATAAVAQALSGAGFKVTEKEKKADVFARIGVSKQQEQSLFQVQINGKTKVNYKVTVVVQIVDRDGKAIDKVEGSYSSSEGEADQGEVTDIINKLSASPVLAKYATDTKAERAERKAKAEKERKEAAFRQATEEERKAREKEQREEKARAEGTINEAQKVEREINDVIRKAEAPIPDDKLKELQALIEKLKKLSPDDARYFAQLQLTYTLENTWWMPEAEAPPAIARALSSEVVTSGVNDTKKLAVSFNAKAGNCYTVLLRYKTPGGNEEIKDIEWSAKGGNTPLQRYTVSWGPGDYSVKGTQRTVGTCVTKDAAVSLAADLTFAGTKNGLRYVVVSAAKAKFPLLLSTYLALDMSDPCDYDAWAQQWTDPIPGALVYTDKEPFLLGRADRAGQTWVSMWSATRTEVRSQKRNLSSNPPAKVKFGTQFRFPGCSKEVKNAEGADAIRFAKCHAQIDAKYKAQWDAAERARDNAIFYTAKRVAEAQLNRIDEADARDREQLCAPIEKQIATKWEAAFNKIVDAYTESPKKSPIDRMGELDAQDHH